MQLKIEQIKYQNLLNEHNNLKNNINIYKKENSELKEKINKIQQEKDKLFNDLAKANKIISNFQNNKINNDSINIINNLKNELQNKEKEINDLKLKISNKDKNEYVNKNNLMVVNFISGDSKISEGIICDKTETFAEVEERLYKIYDDYRNTNNIFITGGNVVLRFKKMCENNIKNGDKIQIQVPE